MGLFPIISIIHSSGFHWTLNLLLQERWMGPEGTQVPTISHNCVWHLCVHHLYEVALLLSLLWLHQPTLDVSMLLWRNCGRSVLYMFVYSVLISLAAEGLIMPSLNASKQLSFLLTCALYAVCLNPPYINPALARIYSVCCIGLVWTSGVIWATPILQTLFNEATDSVSAFWFCWGYSYPVVIGLGFVQTGHLTQGYRWRDLFLVKKSDDLRCIYLQTAQLVKYMEIVKKS